jgi:hypothetical protein
MLLISETPVIENCTTQREHIKSKVSKSKVSEKAPAINGAMGRCRGVAMQAHPQLVARLLLHDKGAGLLSITVSKKNVTYQAAPR